MNTKYNLWVCFTTRGNQYDYTSLSCLKSESKIRCIETMMATEGVEIKWKDLKQKGWRCKKVTVTIEPRT